MTDLLRARGGADRAIECVSAAGQHLSFVCHVAEFVREARAAMTAQCNEILEEALQQEVALLQHDRYAPALFPCLFPIFYPFARQVCPSSLSLPLSHLLPVCTTGLPLLSFPSVA